MLRQHYVKVHAAKKFPCPSEGCPLTFANAAALARHLASECGREFACETCGVKYRSHENLLTHGRRRGHVVDRQLQFTSQCSWVPKFMLQCEYHTSLSAEADSMINLLIREQEAK